MIRRVTRKMKIKVIQLIIAILRREEVKVEERRRIERKGKLINKLIQRVIAHTVVAIIEMKKVMVLTMKMVTIR